MPSTIIILSPCTLRAVLASSHLLQWFVDMALHPIFLSGNTGLVVEFHCV